MLAIVLVVAMTLVSLIRVVLGVMHLGLSIALNYTSKAYYYLKTKHNDELLKRIKFSITL